MYKLLYKNPDCGLNITWRQLDHENRSELTYVKKNLFKNNIFTDIFRFKYCYVENTYFYYLRFEVFS